MSKRGATSWAKGQKCVYAALSLSDLSQVLWPFDDWPLEVSIMKNMSVIIILMSLSFVARAEGVWGDNNLSVKSNPEQDELIQAELADEIELASGLKKVSKTHNSSESGKVKPIDETPMTEELAIAKLGSELADAETKVSQAEAADRKAELRARKLAKKERKKKLSQLKALKASKKIKTLSSKSKHSFRSKVS